LPRSKHRYNKSSENIDRWNAKNLTLMKKLYREMVMLNKIILCVCILSAVQLKSFPAIDSKIIDSFKKMVREASINEYDPGLFGDARIPTEEFSVLEDLIEKILDKSITSPTEDSTILIRFMLPNGLENAHKLFFDQKPDSLSDGLIKMRIAPLAKFNGNAQSARNFADTYLASLTKRINDDKQQLNTTKAFAATNNQNAINTINRYLTAAVLWELEKAVNGPSYQFDLAFDIVEAFKQDKYSKSLLQTSLYKEAVPHTAKNRLEQLSQALTSLL